MGSSGVRDWDLPVRRCSTSGCVDPDLVGPLRASPALCAGGSTFSLHRSESGQYDARVGFADASRTMTEEKVLRTAGLVLLAGAVAIDAFVPVLVRWRRAVAANAVKR